MEITKLDGPDDDGLMERLAVLCERVDDLLKKLHGGGQIFPADVEAVQREAVLIGLERAPELFRRFAARVPTLLN